ncbi:LysR family transcriptional regulator [Gluconacetobacter azotocaptans]|uniref:LysR family transcriptional regulator n=1 Tax=Gluconacetobacter azotocaptans TaxID=142834 RepID=A0A7W4JSV9_9PROT|nr:LysR family transcriptional regulator [Gluconacetobacter azotocaptans]MBB2190293.1 LysR family transcriptional regulator [Gluconacetobacter azotocaptans]MBM9400673.1 LysR family transcriptional regulator [Gluconacetobacter azotocaptans]GBQ27407.1 LysR family transcriptional regulator [Gluconacetobacter azotocaptans DSM 13594]
MDTRFLESFIIVIEHGSLAEAARQLGITPAAVAQRIRALEDEIGCTLMQRTGRTVKPTEHGLAIIENSRSIITSVKDLRAVAALDEPVGKLRLGAISSVVSGILPTSLKLFFERFPDIELHIIPGASSELHNRVQDGSLDAAFIAEPPFDIPKTCRWCTFRSEPLVVLAHAGIVSNDPAEILRGNPFIRYDRNHWGGRLADTCLRRWGIWPHERLELDSLEAIAIMVSQGIGVSLVPDWAPPWPAGIDLRKIGLPRPAPCRNVGMLWQNHSPRRRLVERLLQVLAERHAPSDAKAL